MLICTNNIFSSKITILDNIKKKNNDIPLYSVLYYTTRTHII